MVSHHIILHRYGIDIVLQDFCQVVGHYGDLVEHERVYFRKLLPAGIEAIPSPITCEPGFVDLPWESRAATCEKLEEEGGETNMATHLSHSYAKMVSLTILSIVYYFI